MQLKQGMVYKCLIKDQPHSLYSYWVSPIDPLDRYHTENMLINVATGEIRHYSHFNIVSFGVYEDYF